MSLLGEPFLRRAFVVGTGNCAIQPGFSYCALFLNCIYIFSSSLLEHRVTVKVSTS